MLFNHSGSLGDVLYSLNFAREHARARGEAQFDIHLQTDVPSDSPQLHPSGKWRMSEPLARWLAPLLEAQPYISRVTVSPKFPRGSFNLDEFRNVPLFMSAGDIRYYYYTLALRPLPKDLASPMIVADPDERTRGKIVIFRTARYHNPLINYAELFSLADDMVFLGLPEEHAAFCREAFPVEYLPTPDALAAARLIAGADMIIGNQTVLFAIAEQLKVPRLLESAQIMITNGMLSWGCPNVLPLGGSCRILTAPPTPAEVDEMRHPRG